MDDETRCGLAIKAHANSEGKCWTPELQAGAQAMREFLKTTEIGGRKLAWHVRKTDGTNEYLFHSKTRSDCQQWIDCQAFAAGLAAVSQGLHVDLDA